MRKFVVFLSATFFLSLAFVMGWYLAWKSGKEALTLRQAEPTTPPPISSPPPPVSVPLVLPQTHRSEPPPDQDLRFTPVVNAVNEASPAVVHISTSRIQRVQESPFGPWRNDPFFEFFNQFFDMPEREYKVQSLGTGFIIHKDGYVLTNNHVIERATNVTITMGNERNLAARLVGADPDNDIAILKVDAGEPLPVLELGDSDQLMIGEPVIAIGNPFGFDHTVTTGVISALHRSVKAENIVYHDFIQTDAAINPGNSGGPLLNIYGKVIGVNTAILAKGEGIGFAIPVNLARRISGDLIAFGKVRQTWWGLRLSERPSVNGNPQGGLRVELIIKGSPADEAGLQVGDIILRVGDTDLKSLDDFYRAWGVMKPGDIIRLNIRRSGREFSKNLILRSISLDDSLNLLWSLLGFRGEWINERQAQRMGLPAEARFEINQVRPGSPADKIGFRPGDVIYQIQDQYMIDEDHLSRAAVTLPQRERVMVRVIRGNFIYTVNISIGNEHRIRPI